MSTTPEHDLGATRHLVVSQRLRERRRTLGLTQKQVVRRLSRLGVTSSNKALSSLEHGAGLDVAKLPELALALDCSVTWLLGLTDDPSRWEPDQAGPRPLGASQVPAAPQPIAPVGGTAPTDRGDAAGDPSGHDGPGPEGSPPQRPRPRILGSFPGEL